MGKRGPQAKVRISGTGYTKGEAANLKYCKQATDGTYEIDTDAIGQIAEDYTERSHRVKIRTKGNSKGTWEETYIEPISYPGLRIALGIANKETYDLWRDGYVNRDHRSNDRYGANIGLSEAIRAGEAEIARYLVEDEDSSKSSLIIRQLESSGEIGPAQSKVDIGGKISLGKYSKWAK